MAILSRNSILQGATKSIGGLTLRYSKGVTTIQSKKWHGQHSSPDQILVRQTMLTAQSQYTGLSAAQVQAWKDYTTFAGTKNWKTFKPIKTGHAQFIYSNFMKLLLGGSPITDPTQDKPTTTTKFLSIRSNGGSLALLTTSALLFPTWKIYLRLTPPVPPSQNSNQNKRRMILFTNVAGATQDITAAYYNTFKLNPIVGDRLFYDFVVFNNDVGNFQNGIVYGDTLVVA